MMANTPVLNQDGVCLHTGQTESTLQGCFAHRLPWVTSPSDGLKMLAHFGCADGPDLILCLELAYLELIKARNALGTQLELSLVFPAILDNYWQG